MQLQVAFDNSDVVLAVEVSNEMSVRDFMAYALEEAGFPSSPSTCVQWGESVLDKSKSLEESGVKDQDMLVISNSNVPSTASRAPPRAQTSAPGQTHGINTRQQVEELRQEILYNPDVFTRMSRVLPELASSIHDPEEFAQAFAEHSIMRQNVLSGIGGGGDTRGKFEELKQLQQLDDNYRAAIEEMPESLIPVTMLYIPIEINGSPVKAFVDSGAQATIISPEYAEKCQIAHLIDKRFKGVAYGVGQSEIIGRIHMVPIKIGSSFFPCGFTVIGGTGMDLLFGLDMLRHHQASIDLKRNALVLGDEAVQFLGEADLPESANRFKGQAPAQSAAQGQTPQFTGQQQQQQQQSQRPQPPQRPQQSHLSQQRPENTLPSANAEPFQVYQGPQNTPVPPLPQYQGRTNLSSQGQISPPSQPRSSSTNESTHPAAPPPDFEEDVVQRLISFGFKRAEVIQALISADGNPELAANLLFEN